jgi:hypothetical protein
MDEKDKEFAIWCLKQGFNKTQVKQILLKKGILEGEIDSFLNQVQLESSQPKVKKVTLKTMFFGVLFAAVCISVLYVLLVPHEKNPEKPIIIEPVENQTTTGKKEKKTEPEIALLDCIKSKDGYILVFKSFKNYSNVSVFIDNTTLTKDFTDTGLTKIQTKLYPETLKIMINNSTKVIDGVTCGH